MSDESLWKHNSARPIVEPQTSNCLNAPVRPKGLNQRKEGNS